jgi:hypothetical protein
MGGNSNWKCPSGSKNDATRRHNFSRDATLHQAASNSGPSRDSSSKHLEQRLRDAAYVQSLRDAFLAAYLAETDDELAARVPLHMALIHLKRACKRFRWQDEPGWPDIVRRQIGESATCMQAAEHIAALPRGVEDVAAIYDCCPATL